MASCTASQTASAIVAGPSSLPTPSSFVKKEGNQLVLDGQTWRASGPNVYWLGLDENVTPSPSFPSQERIIEALATVVAMGGNAFRCTTCGVSVGCSMCMENALDRFNEDAMRIVDFVLNAARMFGLRVVIPLTDNYDYYHGGIPSFLRWRNLSDSDHSPFYDTTSEVYGDFSLYVKTLLTRNNTVNGIRWGQDPTILAFETGNELGGWGGSSPPPVAWTAAISAFMKELAPNTLVVDGTYGLYEPALDVNTTDVVSNHFYPPFSSRLKSDASSAARHQKVYLVGEYQWNGRLEHLNLLFALVPFLVAIGVCFLPKRWFPVNLRSPVRRRKPPRPIYRTLDSNLPLSADFDLPPPISASREPSTPSIYENKVIEPQTVTSLPTLPTIDRSTRPHKHTVKIQKWHLSIFCGLWIPITIGIAWVTGPSTLGSFLRTAEQSTAVGTFYWSLFGRTNNCCSYVQHDDGYTLHWPGDSSDMRSRAIQLANHARSMTGHSLPVSAVSADQIQVACPQPDLLTTSRIR